MWPAFLPIEFVNVLSLFDEDPRVRGLPLRGPDVTLEIRRDLLVIVLACDEFLELPGFDAAALQEAFVHRTQRDVAA